DHDVGAATVVDPSAPAGDLVDRRNDDADRLRREPVRRQRDQRVPGDRRVGDLAAGVEPQAAAGVRTVAGDQAVADHGRRAGDAEHAPAAVGEVVQERDALERDRALVQDPATEVDLLTAAGG